MMKGLYLIVFGVLLFTSCAPTRYYRTLEQGEHAVTGQLFGPIINVPGISPMPIPLSSLGYGYGATDYATVFGNWHTTAAVFGVWHFDAGATFKLWQNEKRNMGVSVSPAAHFMVDQFEKNFRFYPTLDMNYYIDYKVKQKEGKFRRNDFFVGFDNMIDPYRVQAHGEPNRINWLWNTHFGTSFYRNRWAVQLEVQLLAPYLSNQNIVVDYISPFGKYGAMGFYLGITRTLGGKTCKDSAKNWNY
jgi:hypothetical protein